MFACKTRNNFCSQKLLIHVCTPKSLSISSHTKTHFLVKVTNSTLPHSSDRESDLNVESKPAHEYTWKWVCSQIYEQQFAFYEVANLSKKHGLSSEFGHGTNHKAPHTLWCFLELTVRRDFV